MGSLTPDQWTELAIEADSDLRLDLFLTRVYPELSRSAAQRLIEEGHVRVNGAPARASRKLMAGERLSVFLPAPKPSALVPQAIPLEILYQDEHLAVIHKPAGLVVHPAAGHADGTLVNALLHHLGDLSAGGGGIGGELRPGIVHRIDRNTSGVLLVTKTDLAHRHLTEQFKEHSVSRRYVGLCWGKLPASGEWNQPIARDPKDRKRMAIVEGGRRAVTRYRTLAHWGKAATLFEATLLTGRTHQIRVHFAAHGHPLAGDEVYVPAYRPGREAREKGLKELSRVCPKAAEGLGALEQEGRQFLHAAHLGFTHPATGERLAFDRPLPPELERIVLSWDACRAPLSPFLTQSPLLASVPGLRHGFTNLRLPETEREALENATATARQVHRAEVAWIDAFEKARDADGLATFRPGLRLGVFSADCAPVLTAAVDNKTRSVYAVMALHAGWRGTALGIAGQALRAFATACRQRRPDSRFVAVIGPCISRESFEVGEEVVAEFPGSLPRGLATFLRLEGERRKYLFDLPGENLRQLREAQAELRLELEVEALAHCTVRDAELYPSYRRQRGQAGRILSFLEFGE